MQAPVVVNRPINAERDPPPPPESQYDGTDTYTEGDPFGLVR